MGLHLDFYYKCMDSGKIPIEGLCNCEGLIDQSLLDLFEPTIEDIKVLRKEELSTVFWASGVKLMYALDEERSIGFTPLRQTIVLFMAAMNNEL